MRKFGAIEMKTGVSKNCAFSLVEVMIATGILTIGFAFIAGVFPVAIKLVASATETTMAPIVKQEAFAKIRLYGVDPASANWPVDGGGNLLTNTSVIYAQVAPAAFLPWEYDYPSAVTTDDKNYSWSAICRYVGSPSVTDVEVTVFVSRKAGAGARPMPVKVEVTVENSDPTRKFQINATPPINLENGFIVLGAKVVRDFNGQIYTVVSRKVLADRTVEIEVDKDLPPGAILNMWVVPPAVGGGRNPCIGISQRTIGF